MTRSRFGRVWCKIIRIDGTITSTLSATTVSEFDPLALISWLGSAYLIGTAAVQPLSGKLTDIFSRRAGLLLCSVLFGLGNLVCGLAHREWVMIAGRMCAGFGGGGIVSISTFVGTDLIPLRKRGLWQGPGNIVYGFGVWLGGLVGGLVNDTLGWRWAFLIVTPLTFLSALGICWVLPKPLRREEGSIRSRLRRIDFTGALLLLLTIILLLTALNLTSSGLPWKHPLVIVPLSLTAVFLALFIYVETYVAMESIIPVQRCFDRSVIGVFLAIWFDSMALFILMYYVPLFFQVQGRSTTRVYLQLLPESIGIATGFVVSGMITRNTGLEIVTCKLYVRLSRSRWVSLSWAS